MKHIPLTQGQVAIVDDEDYEWLSKHKWHAVKDGNTYYARRQTRLSNGKQRPVLMHREILGLCYGDKREVDHINHNGLDNRRENIRPVSREGNAFNRGYDRGYHWDARHKKYQGRIVVRGEHIFLGYFDTKEESRAAYLAAKKKLHIIKHDLAKHLGDVEFTNTDTRTVKKEKNE